MPAAAAASRNSRRKNAPKESNGSGKSLTASASKRYEPSELDRDIEELEGDTKELPRTRAATASLLGSEEAQPAASMHALLAQGTLLSRGIDEHAEEASPKVGPRGLADAANRLSVAGMSGSGKGWAAAKLGVSEGSVKAQFQRKGKSAGWRTFRKANAGGLFGKALVFHDNVQNFQKVRGVFQDTHDECFEAGGVVECIADGFGGFGDRDYVNVGPSGAPATEDQLRTREKIKERHERTHKTSDAAAFVVDVVRGQVVCVDEAVMYDVYKAIVESPALAVCRVANRVKRPTITGYRDLKVNVKVTTDLAAADGAKIPHTCEVVIHHKVMLNLSDEHDACKVYDFFRSFLLGGEGADDERRRASVLMQIPTSEISTMESVAMKWLEDHEGALERLTTFNHLMRAIGEFELAEMVQGRIVDLTIQTFGAGSIDHARAMEGLAMVLYAQEKYKEAEPIFRDSMRLKEERLSHNDPELGPLLSYMSLCLERQGNFEDAVGPSRRALEIREAQLGPDHPDVAKLLNTQANLHYAQGRYEHADPLYRRALHITERRMGEKHPDVATALNNLASLLYQTRQYGAVYGEAMAQYERALGIRERQLGPEHPDVATLVNNMAALLAAQKKLAEAKPLYERAMDIYAKRLGSEHPLFATALTNLATMYRQMNDFQAAVPLYRLALRLRAKHYGEVHLEVAAATTVLAAVLRNLHRFDEAKALYKKALKTREECAGKISRPVATSFNNLGHCHNVPYAKSLVGLGTCYMELRKWTDAVDSYAQAVAIIERSDGPDSTDLVRPLKDLAIALSKLGRNKEARENRRKSVAVHRAIAREGGGNSMMETSLRATSKTCVIS
ncbi:hypothetical protein JL722_461 [Aureococcus anophagefferens]|nr:hypothetical protein JL722_461 [Aureococcus anophagefferens]